MDTNYLISLLTRCKVNLQKEFQKSLIEELEQVIKTLRGN